MIDYIKINISICNVYYGGHRTNEVMLQACAKARSPGNYVDRCFIVLNEMKKFGIEGNVHFYNLILQTCANERDEENALIIFQRKLLYHVIEEYLQIST